METTYEEANAYLLKSLRESPDAYGDYGYGVYLPKILRKYIAEKISCRPDEFNQINPHMQSISSHFYTSAWELCRRGVLRPGIMVHGGQSTSDGDSGFGYTITPYGSRWLSEPEDLYVPTEEGQFATLISKYKDNLGEAFHQRANEAIRCYSAHAYLACCVMCGASAESILLDVAIAKVGNEEEVIKNYTKSDGTNYLRKVFGVANYPDRVKKHFESAFDLIKRWRDTAGHGLVTDMDEAEAYFSLGALLRLADYIDKNKV